MTKYEFVHCNVHSEFSLLDASSRVKDIVSAAAKQDMRAIALTDHNVMYGAIDFYKKAKDSDIKPLIGHEAHVTNTKMTEKSSKETKN